MPIHPIDPLSITDPSLGAVVRLCTSQGQPLTISSHDHAFHDDDDTHLWRTAHKDRTVLEPL